MRSTSSATRAHSSTALRNLKLLAEHGQRQEVLDAGQVARLDPVFEPVTAKIAGAVRDVGDSAVILSCSPRGWRRLCRDKLGY